MPPRHFKAIPISKITRYHQKKKNLRSFKTLIRLEEKDYEEFCQWWSFWKFQAPPLDSLPNKGLGGLKIIFVDDEGQANNVCAGFLYETDSAIAWLEFIISSPKIKDRKIRYESQVDLIRYLTVQAGQKGYKYVFSSLENKNLISKFKEVGYVESNTSHKELIIKL